MLSMTGYGRAASSFDGRQLTVELKSVNHRFLDLAFRMPRNFAFLEDDMRKAISARLARGHVEVYVSFLRKKLASIGSNLQIEAVRRLGYHLEVQQDD